MHLPRRGEITTVMPLFKIEPVRVVKKVRQELLPLPPLQGFGNIGSDASFD
jgi:hypothetical protein